MEEEVQTSENMNGISESDEIVDGDYDKMKGDAIGETLYSAKWILNALIRLSKIYEEGWSESMENDLCTLWDMTAEKDIVEFLIENDFFKLAEFTLKTSEEPRLTEIIVGIIGNMCCVTKCLEMLVDKNELVSIILSLISSDDKETLIQVLRILQACIWDIQKNSNSPWVKQIEDFEILGEAVCFILRSSTSDELLTPTIELVYLISEVELPDKDKFFETIFKVDEAMFSMCESMLELITHDDISHSESQITNIENWLSIMFNVMRKSMLTFSDEGLDENFKKINSVILRILKPYENYSNLIPSEEKILNCIQECVKLTLSFQKSEIFPDFVIIKAILMIMLHLKAAASESGFEDNQDSNELYDYITKYWTETLNASSSEQTLEILKLLDHRGINNLIQVTKSLPNVNENCTNKILQAQTSIIR